MILKYVFSVATKINKEVCLLSLSILLCDVIQIKMNRLHFGELASVSVVPFHHLLLYPGHLSSSSFHSVAYHELASDVE
jgi:hypothetical protein